MRFTHAIKIILLALLVMFSAQGTFAVEEDPLNQEVQNLFAMPNKVTTTTDEGDTVETFVSPGTTNSVGTIKKKDGSWIQFTRTASSGGGFSYSFTDNKWVKTSATQDKNGIISGDGNSYVPAANKTEEQNKDHMSDCSGSQKLCTITTEEVPWADCRCIDTTGNNCTKVETRKYECSTGKGLTGFQEVIAKIIRFTINIVLLLWVLAVVWLGIAWSFAGGDDVKMKSTIKTWGINIVVWLLILFLFGYILRFLAPWVYM